MPKPEDKVNFDYEHTVEHLQEVKNDINIIKTHTKWVLSLLAAIALGLASFVFTDLGELHIIYKELSKPDLLIKVFAGSLFILYSGFIIAFIPWILWGVKIPATHKNKEFVVLSKAEETKILKIKAKKYNYKLFIIDKRFKRLIIASISSPLVAAAFAIYFTYFA